MSDNERTYTPSEVAAMLHDALETRRRDDGSEFVTRRDYAPEWVQDVVRAAHGDMMPDDWRYRMIQHAAEVISLAGPDAGLSDLLESAHESADHFTPWHTADIVGWLASRTDRYGYVDEATMEVEYGGDIIGAITAGIVAEYVECYSLLAHAIVDATEVLNDG